MLCPPYDAQEEIAEYRFIHEWVKSLPHTGKAANKGDTRVSCGNIPNVRGALQTDAERRAMHSSIRAQCGRVDRRVAHVEPSTNNSCTPCPRSKDIHRNRIPVRAGLL